jgi:hypothetical protein
LDHGGGVPKPVAIQGRKALGVARRKPVQKSAVPAAGISEKILLLVRNIK